MYVAHVADVCGEKAHARHATCQVNFDPFLFSLFFFEKKGKAAYLEEPWLN